MKSRFQCLFIPLMVLGLATISLNAEAKRDREVFHLDEVYPLAKDGTIYLSTGDAEVKIIGSERNDVHVAIDYEGRTSGLFWESGGEPFKVEVTPDEGDLIIEEVDRDVTRIGILISSSCIEYKVLLEVPIRANLDVRGDDDEYQIRNVQGKIAMDFDDGEAIIEDCNGGFYDLEAEDGCIEMRGGSGSLEVACEDGEISISKGAFSEIRAEVEDGDMEIATKIADDGIYALECEDGWIKFTVLAGGGEFRVDYDDGRVRASSEFEEAEEEDGLAIYSLPGGKARVRIRIEDGKVRLLKR